MSVEARTKAVFSNIPTRWVVMALGALIVGIGILFSGLNYIVANSFKQTSAQSEILMSSMRAHMTADMLHDGLRGVVFHAMYAGAIGDAAEASGAQSELGEYGGEFRDAIATQDALAVRPASRRPPAM